MKKLTKTGLYLLLILLMAFLLRLIAAHHTHVSTDEMIYSIIPLNIISSGQLGTVEQSPLFFYLTDIGYRLFGGITAISARFFAIIFGSLAVLVVYLFSRELWGDNCLGDNSGNNPSTNNPFINKSGWLAAFLFALSGYTLINNTEMDMMAFFFSLLSMLFFVYYLKRNNSRDFYLSVIFLALAVLVKNIVLLFLPAYVLAFGLARFPSLPASALAFFSARFSSPGGGKEEEKREKKTFNFRDFRKGAKILLTGLLIFLILLSPVLIYNYFTYQKLDGLTDYYFSETLGIGRSAHGEDLTGNPWEGQRFLAIFQDLLLKLFRTDTLILLGGLGGIILSFRNNKSAVSRPAVCLLLISLLSLTGYIAGQTGSPAHFLWIPLSLSIFAGGAWVWTAEKMRTRFRFGLLIPLLLIIALVLSFLTMQEIVSSRKDSITLSLRDYVHENIPDDAVVVIDPRIYRGIHAWVFNDKHYLEGTNFVGLVRQSGSLGGGVKERPLFYIECGAGTYCGWKPEDFQRINQTGGELSLFFRERLPLVKEIRAGHNFNIYRGGLELPAGAYEIIDRSHQFWFYPVGWKEPELAVDYYQVEGFDWWLAQFGRSVLWLEIALALLAIPLVLFLAGRKSQS